MHPIRYLIRLVEGYFELTRKHAYRSWYNPEEDRFVNVGFFSSHVADVAKRPEEYGLTREDVSDERPSDRDPTIMNLMCSRGWIRVAASDRQNPNKAMFFEGAHLKPILRLMRRFYRDQDGELMAASIKIRSLEGSGGVEYILRTPEAVKAAAMRGEMPEPYTISADDSLAA